MYFVLLDSARATENFASSRAHRRELIGVRGLSRSADRPESDRPRQAREQPQPICDGSAAHGLLAIPAQGQITT